MSHRKGLSRRDFLRAGVVAGGVVMLGAPFARFISPVQARLSDVPVVDRLVVTTVVDAYYDMLAPAETRGSLAVERAHAQIHAQHGLALFLESERGNETKRVMLDFAWTPESLMHNMNVLDVDTNSIDAMVLSHGHSDHFGGLMEFVDAYREFMPAEVPLYVGGDDALCKRWIGPPENRRSFGVLDRTGLEEAGVKVVKSESGAVVAGHGFTSGVIERDTMEKVIPNTTVEIGEMDGNGCTGAQHEAHFSGEELEGNFLFDHHWGEHATAYHVKDRGLVVISSCGHAGLVNSVKQARRASGVDKVHAVMGGFHLSPADPGYVEDVIDLLIQETDPDYVMPMHCTGANFSYIMAAKYPDRLVDSYVGTRFVFGA